ncbi:MAG: hypothetical protein AAGK05_00070 [Pseudomonadota bacterium]
MTAELTLSEPVKDEVNKTYKQYLKVHGKRALIAVPEFFRDTALKFNFNNKISSVLVPLDDTTRNTLSSLETFVQANVNSDKYKPLWLKDNMYVNISQWCRYEQVNNDGTRSTIQPGSFLGRGFYSLLIHASHVYVGPHKGGETYSLSLYVVHITYKPADDIMELIECLSDIDRPPAPTAFEAPFQIKKPAKKKRAPRSKKNGSQDEIDGPKTVPTATHANSYVL